MVSENENHHVIFQSERKMVFMYIILFQKKKLRLFLFSGSFEQENSQRFHFNPVNDFYFEFDIINEQ